MIKPESESDVTHKLSEQEENDSNYCHQYQDLKLKPGGCRHLALSQCQVDRLQAELTQTVATFKDTWPHVTSTLEYSWLPFSAEEASN